MSDLVTGEAVVLDLQTAKLPSRALAIVLDLLVEFAALFVFSLMMSVALADIDTAALAATMLGMTVFFLVALPVMIETLTHGRSLGKAALGLRVVRTDGGPVRFRHSLVRGLVGFFEVIAITGAPAVITSALNSDGKRLGDIFAGTVVIRERTPGVGGPASPLPPVHPQLLHDMGRELVAMDLSAVPEPLWLAIRQLLGRIGQLEPSVTFRMSTGLADDLATRIGNPVPQGLHPAAYLGVVLTERQRREWLRVQQQFARQQFAAPVPVQAPAPHPVATPGGVPHRVLGLPAAPAPTDPGAAAPAAPSFTKPPQPAAPTPPTPETGFAPPA
ncbi:MULTISPECIES: RDD family protein [Kitasatospora]|uniref:RDD family protein n=1 Tax=Kitasatospora cathayae TaxID=3004092 RepID=A0ABY7Q7B6_9ACTN|nr:RDD family protein [Kitasatospora sp. HUAS 3-15]WBP88590.1 RDD family protein [Kitasatospora sp. HUAS 3-15]